MIKSFVVIKTNFLVLVVLVAQFFIAESYAAISAVKNHKSDTPSKESSIITSPDFVAIKVNNKVITDSEVTDRYRFVLKASKIKVSKHDDEKVLRERIIDKMIEEELIRQEAKRLKIEVSEDEIEEAIDIISAQRSQTKSQFKKFFTKNSLSFEGYFKQIESEILWSKIISEILRSKVRITNIELREFFEQHKIDNSIKKFLIAEIVIANSENSLQLANKLLVDLRHGADFKEIVHQFSANTLTENSQQSDGEIGWVSRLDINEKIYAAIINLNKGQYCEPVLLADGYHIFKMLDSKIEANFDEKEVDAAKSSIFNKKLQNLAKGYLMDLRRKAFVEIYNS